MNKPNFIIAGEAKAGTTALYSYLTQHPDVFVCEPKEPRYFAFQGARPSFTGYMDEEWVNETTIYDRASYYRLFEQANGMKSVGEASPVYVHIPGCASAIAKELPDVKIIILLRNPVRLAFSAYQHMARVGVEKLTFEQALDQEDERIENNWAWHWRYRSLGFVAKNIESFLQHFPRDQILFLNYDEFQSDNMASLKRVCDFLEIESDFDFKPTRVNVNVRARLVWLGNMLRARDNHIKNFLRAILPKPVRQRMGEMAMKLNSAPMKETISDETYRSLLSIYRRDIEETERLTHLDLKKWY